MSWRIDFSKDAIRFLDKNNLEEDIVIDEIKFILRKFQGENLNLNIKKLHGKWKDFYRIRSGKMRIILTFQFEIHQVYIDKIDWRGSAYK